MKSLLILGILAVAMVAVAIIFNRVPSFDEKRKRKSEVPQTPGAARAKNKLWLVIAVILLGLLIWVGVGKKKALPPQQAAAKFRLKAGEETPTVEVGQGTHHRLWADKPYLAISVQRDGSRITYPMPDGWETWNGDEPGGRLRLIGVEEDTLVRIVPVKY
ncbi:hypothetical protein A3G50_01090 [Candidatus Jorgensenbacteria bacterium RIFCSPLOWO2_12_FULL_42_11]|uniref:Uncharacterized protein n=1 Tax=Candidatus Jorgensenbacteria bacterium RIFCSPLOWO2_12_FULL_42_11 TaxID=1798473 RepID=A0A1F6C357_9BACT|nr:MAG: hypothetical protein A3G50_01090 [Candidatus Jorgensenbacteria bacterium RIFCSPLOWO2_12_FULL_42_11]